MREEFKRLQLLVRNHNGNCVILGCVLKQEVAWNRVWDVLELQGSSIFKFKVWLVFKQTTVEKQVLRLIYVTNKNGF